MPSIKLSPRFAAWTAALVVAGCATFGAAPGTDGFAQLPREIRSGAADTVIQPVERDASPDEISSAISRIVSSSPVCIGWPTLWLDDVTMRNVYRVRFDLMQRDWGAAVAAASERRMDEYVDMGFLTKRAREDVGPDVVEYTLTDLGRRYLTGSPYGGEHPSFCAPSERRVTAVTGSDFGQFDCGTLRVHFTFEAPESPSWAPTAAARDRVAQSSDAPPQGQGVVTLGRQWFRPDVLPAGQTNGSLQSACVDRNHRNVVGNDLNLNVGP